jgi:hypothetical protein
VGYLKNGGACTVDLSAVSGAVTLKYYNPMTGALSSGTVLSPSASTAIPAPSFSGDAAIWIVAEGALDDTPPSNVDGLGASASGQTINLSWNAASDAESGISGYEIYRGTSAGPTALLTTVANVTSFQDNTGAEATTFYYRVKAINSAGLKSTNYSNEASATTAADTEKPAIESVSAAGASSVRVVFSEKVEELSAENPANYSIDNSVSVSGAVLQADEKSVLLSTSALTEDLTYTLTVNNVMDRASSPNTIVPNSQATFTFVGELILTSLSVSSGKSYVWDTLANGKTVYIDRSYTFSNVPSKYNGLVYLQTANEDKFSSGSPFISFTANQNVMVYLAYAGSSLPAWASGWTNTGDVIVTTDRSLTVYAKEFPAGTVSLGENGGAPSMYSVIVTKAGGPTVETGDAGMPPRGQMVMTASPNPFNSAVKIKLRNVEWGMRNIPSLYIFNVNGKLIFKSTLRTPHSTLEWNACHHPAGIYIARLTAGTTMLTRKLYLLK